MSTTKIKVSKTNKVAKPLTSRQATAVVKKGVQVLNTQSSSFIQSLVVNPTEKTAEVVMARNPKTVYVYSLTVKGLQGLQRAEKNGKSMGAAFNKWVRDREVCRTVYR